jgi:hypothetical protein
VPLFNLRALLCGTRQYFLEAEYILVMECVLVITTKDILQLLPINGRPPMTSAHMISSYHRLNLYFLGTLGDSSNRIVDQEQQCQRNRLHSQCQPKIRVGRQMTSRHLISPPTLLPESSSLSAFCEFLALPAAMHAEIVLVESGEQPWQAFSLEIGAKNKLHPSHRFFALDNRFPSSFSLDLRHTKLASSSDIITVLRKHDRIPLNTIFLW